MIVQRQLPRAVPAEIPPTKVSFIVPLLPPSVNHYKEPAGVRPDRSTGILRPTYRVTAAGRAYKEAVAIFARGQSIIPADERERERVRYKLAVVIVLGKGNRGDGDNFWKVVADGLVDACVIHSDAKVRRWVLDIEEFERPPQGYTEITASVLERI